MFGYVRCAKQELRVRDYDRYYAAYCGVCGHLGKGYGFFSRFLVNYDMTFLYLLLASVKPAAQTTRCWCPARVVCSKPCVDDAALLDYVAAVDVILCRHKLEDNIADSGFFKASAYRFAKLLTARGYRKAKNKLPEFDRLIREHLSVLQLLEQERSGSIDRTADAFAQILSECAGLYDDPAVRRPMAQLLYHVGRFIYLVDALDDLEQDCKTGNYNPLRYRFVPENGKLSAQDSQYMSDILNGSINTCGAALELLPLQTGRELLENILYLGLPLVLKAVQNGEFRPHAKM